MTQSQVALAVIWGTGALVLVAFAAIIIVHWASGGRWSFRREPKEPTVANLLLQRTKAGELVWQSISHFISGRREGEAGDVGTLGPVGILMIAYVARDGGRTWQLLEDFCINTHYMLHLDGEQIEWSVSPGLMDAVKTQVNANRDEAQRPTLEHAARIARGPAPPPDHGEPLCSGGARY